MFTPTKPNQKAGYLPDGKQIPSGKQQCSQCNGTGKPLLGFKCMKCNGTGYC